MLDCLLRLVVFFLIAQFVSIRGSKGGPLDVPRQWQCGICEAIRCWPTRNHCYKCGQPRSASSCSPRSSTCLDPQGTVGGLPQGFPRSSHLNPGMVHGPLGRGPPPKRSQTLPHLGVAPLRPLSPLLVLALVMCGLMLVLSTPLLPLCLRNLLIRFSPLGLLPVVPPLFLLVRLMILWRISSVLWSSLVPSWTPPEVEALRSRLVPPPLPVPSEPAPHSPTGLLRRNWQTSVNDKKSYRLNFLSNWLKLRKRSVCLSVCKLIWLGWLRKHQILM